MENVLLIDLNQVYNGKPIRDKRKKLGLSAKELGELIGVKDDNIYKWEKGTKPHDPEDFLKIETWLKDESVPDSKNGAVVQNKAQHGTNSQKQGLDLIKEVTRLIDEHLTVKATLKVLISELAPLISKATGKSHASVSSQMEKDISAEILNLKTYVRKQSGD